MFAGLLARLKRKSDQKDGQNDREQTKVAKIDQVGMEVKATDHPPSRPPAFIATQQASKDLNKAFHGFPDSKLWGKKKTAKMQIKQVTTKFDMVDKEQGKSSANVSISTTTSSQAKSPPILLPTSSKPKAVTTPSTSATGSITRSHSTSGFPGHSNQGGPAVRYPSTPTVRPIPNRATIPTTFPAPSSLPYPRFGCPPPIAGSSSLRHPNIPNPCPVPCPSFLETARPAMTSPAPDLLSNLPKRPSTSTTLLQSYAKQSTSSQQPQQNPGPILPATFSSPPIESLSPSELKIEKLMTPLSRMPLERQRAVKEEKLKGILNSIKRCILWTNPGTAPWMTHQEDKNGFFLKLDRLLHVPPYHGYLTMCDFVVGTSARTGKLGIGFPYEGVNKEGEGPPKVACVAHLASVPPLAKRLASAFEELFTSSGLAAYNFENETGHWKRLSVRTSSLPPDVNGGGAAVLVTMAPGTLDKGFLRHVREKLSTFAAQQPGLTAIYFSESHPRATRPKLELLRGQSYTLERVAVASAELDLRASPQAYLPAHMGAAEASAKVVYDMVEPHQDCSVVDLCCGVGTLGLGLAASCGQVVGLDEQEEAIDDARYNAMANDITNAEFHLGSMEESLPALWHRVIFSQVAVVSDVPAQGLSPKVVAYLRKEVRVRRLALVLSDGAMSAQFLTDLSSPPSANLKGDPFVPIRACPLDSHPHTNESTLIMLLVRADINDLLNPSYVGSKGLGRGWGVSQKVQKAAVTDIAPAPDLSWKAVEPKKMAPSTPTKNYFDRVVQSEPASPEKDYREALLSKEQRDWLDQMTAIYKADFKRKEWMEALLEQNRQAVQQQQQQQQQLQQQIHPPLPTSPPKQSASYPSQHGQQQLQHQQQLQQ